jgi:hypothetical protein
MTITYRIVASFLVLMIIVGGLMLYWTARWERYERPCNQFIGYRVGNIPARCYDELFGDN